LSKQMSFECGFKVFDRIELRRSGVRVFQSWGAEQLKALLPIVMRRASGIVRWREEEERRERAGLAI